MNLWRWLHRKLIDEPLARAYQDGGEYLERLLALSRMSAEQSAAAVLADILSGAGSALDGSRPPQGAKLVTFWRPPTKERQP